MVELVQLFLEHSKLGLLDLLFNDSRRRIGRKSCDINLCDGPSTCDATVVDKDNHVGNVRLAASSVNITCDSSSTNHVQAVVSTVSVDLDCDVDMDAKPKVMESIVICWLGRNMLIM